MFQPLAERRKTVAALTSYHAKVGGHGKEEINFERQFKENFLRPDGEMKKTII